MSKQHTKYKYATRVVTSTKTLEDVDAELNYIYEINNDGKDIMSIQVIPLFNNKKYPTIPSSYVISYIYRYLVGADD